MKAPTLAFPKQLHTLSVEKITLTMLGCDLE